ncbi:MAG: TA system VapC family ribonuclease toxin [Casimicrobium sp.]
MTNSAYLLDASVLIPLLWPPHEKHEIARDWFAHEVIERSDAGWLSCAFTQAAFVRVITQPAFHSPIVSVAEAAALLTRNLINPKHRYIDTRIELVDVLKHCTGGVVGHRQITDAWLVTLAHHASAKLVSFDKRLHTLLATASERERDLVILD